MIDQRRLRFSEISGLERRDLPLACEVWLEDIYRAVWVTRETMKLSAYFMRYVTVPEANALMLREIESQCQLNVDEVRKALVLMRSFGAVEGFAIDRNEVRVALRLSYLQRLRTLEVKCRLIELMGRSAEDSYPWTCGEPKWDPARPVTVQPKPAEAALVSKAG